MCYYRVVCALLIVVAPSVNCDNRNRHKSTISLHQSSSASDEFSALSAYGDRSLFPAGVLTAEQAPTLPILEKQVLELGSLRADTQAISAGSRSGSSGTSNSEEQIEHHPAAQKLYPTFFRNIPPLGHSRPYYQTTETTIEQRLNKLRTGLAAAPVLPEVSSPLLGSGDFGIIKGGTFYYDMDVPSKGFVEDFYGLGYNNNNGHGRPQLAFLAQKPQQKEEQFSNFRDFADINISNDPAYSHKAPLYVAVQGGEPQPRPVVSPASPTILAPAAGETSSSSGKPRHEPENILDELRSLDVQTTNVKHDRRARVPAHGGVKKDTAVDRRKRPKVAKSSKDMKEQPEGEDYMIASS